MDSLVYSMDQIGVWLLVIVLVAPIAIGLYTDDTSCGQGTVLEGHQCTPIGWQGEWTEIEMNCNQIEINPEADDEETF